MGFTYNGEVSEDKKAVMYYKLSDIFYDPDADNDGKYTVNCILKRYDSRGGTFLGSAPVILEDVPLNLEEDIKKQVYEYAKKLFEDFDDELE